MPSHVECGGIYFGKEGTALLLWCSFSPSVLKFCGHVSGENGLCNIMNVLKKYILKWNMDRYFMRNKKVCHSISLQLHAGLFSL